jgi:hypothetical protein
LKNCDIALKPPSHCKRAMHLRNEEKKKEYLTYITNSTGSKGEIL